MKKIYLLLAASVLGFSSINAQTTIINDDMEAHATGSYFDAIWSNWTLTTDATLNLQITEERAASGSKSGYIGNTAQDVFLRFPNRYNAGSLTSSWKMYIPEGKFAYYNLQETRTPGQSWGYECYSNFYSDTFILADGTPMNQKMVWTASVVTESGDTSRIIYAHATIPLDEWFTVKQEFDFDNQKMKLFINETEATYYYYGDNRWPGSYSLGTAGGFNFYKAEDATRECEYFIDDVNVATSTLGIDKHTFQKDLATIYPNPVSNNVFEIVAKENIQNVEIFNVLGQRVLTLTPQSTTVKVNTAQFAAGVYNAQIRTKNNYTTQQIVIK